MSVEIVESVRAGARAVIGLAGPSGTGKTFSALLMAYGLAGCDARKVGLLDTENKRGSLYSDILPGGAKFRRVDLYAPFSPSRYIDGIEAFQRAGVEVLVIDSVTHEWEGPGGCEEIANNPNKRIADWLTAKREHKKFVNSLLLCDMHVICCIRAREKTDFSNPKSPSSLGIQPICEKNFMFEMTASFMLKNEGRERDIIKCPGDLRSTLGKTSGYLGIEDGKALRAWLNGEGGDAYESLRNRLRLAASYGSGRLKNAWQEITASERKALGAEFIAVLKAQAEAVDEQNKAEVAEYEPEPTPQTREEKLSVIKNKCAAGNSYGVTADQIRAHFGTDSFDKLADGEVEELTVNWSGILSEVLK